jgi:D-beta-D-heptose 7-phosphate kinase/D-beta-D-heptose 1-phosphate adenosyltransferase
MPFDTSTFDNCTILVVGDLMIDEYVWGDVDRISPEAPVQVVSVTREDYTLGGAGNVVNNLIALGTRVQSVGVIGDDANGNLLMSKLSELGADTTGIIKESQRPTTIKTRIIAANQHVLRIDRETRRKVSSTSFEKLGSLLEEMIPGADVVLISDYGKGLLTQSFLETLLSTARRHNKITVVDPKGTDYSRYKGATLITPNTKEASLASGIAITGKESLHRAGAEILATSGVEKVLITLGKDGMVLFDQKRKPYKISADARQVFDVSGAGDTVVAVIGLALATGSPFREAMQLANTAAGLVVRKVGTATVSKQELDQALNPYQDVQNTKQIRLADIDTLIKNLKKKGRQIVLTNGCFDLLHAGHIAFFTKAKQYGDVLIVAIDDDDSVRSIKGAGRPVIQAEERVRILSALDVIDHVVVFSTNELTTLIETIQPDVLTKGSNYKQDTVFGHDIVEQCGGRIALIPISDDISSTKLIDKIKNPDPTE